LSCEEACFGHETAVGPVEVAATLGGHLMPRRFDRRFAGVIAASAALHLAILALLALKPAASGFRPYEDDAIAVTLAPLYLVEPKPRARNRQVHLAPIRPRQARRPSEDAPVAPLYVAPAAGRGAAGGGPGVGVETHPATEPPGTRAELGRALRFGGVGCDTPDLVGLTRAERDRCAERFGSGAKSAAYLGQGLSKDKQRLLDQAAARKEAYRNYRDAPMPPGLSTSDAAGGLTGLGESRPTNTHPF
jgi:hypothetical protein